MKAPRSVCTELDALFDVAGARRAGDEIDGARQRRRAIAGAGAQQIPAVFVPGNDLSGVSDDNMRIGQKVQRRWSGLTGHQHQGAGLGDRGQARRYTYRIVRLGAAAPDLQ